MQNNELENLFGKSRVQRYKNTQEDWLYLCEKNIDISKSFYRKLYIFETFLRNRIDVEFTKTFSSDWLILKTTNFQFQERGAVKIKEVHKRFNSKKLTHNDIMENLTFGFWVGLFHAYYNRQVWGMQGCDMMTRIFPSLTNKQKAFKTVAKEIDIIRKFRNKIFHFADILNANCEEVETLLTKYTKGIYNGKEFLIER
ncbi:MAG: hypothetical protein ACI9CD_000298 [Candidatus Deianiraeaceae bacterium]|jgi:hypothetical protein